MPFFWLDPVYVNFGRQTVDKNKIKIPQLLIINELRDLWVPRTGLEPARLSALAPETSASTIPPPGHRFGFASAKVALFSEMTNFFYAFLADYSIMAI